MGVYQDTFLELIESTRLDPEKDKSEAKATSTESLQQEEVVVDRPFLFLLSVDRDILALGRIRDPYWCKFCKKKYTGGNHTVLEHDEDDERQSRKVEQHQKSLWQRVKDFLQG